MIHRDEYLSAQVVSTISEGKFLVLFDEDATIREVQLQDLSVVLPSSTTSDRSDGEEEHAPEPAAQPLVRQPSRTSLPAMSPKRRKMTPAAQPAPAPATAPRLTPKALKFHSQAQPQKRKASSAFDFLPDADELKVLVRTSFGQHASNFGFFLSQLSPRARGATRAHRRSVCADRRQTYLATMPSLDQYRPARISLLASCVC